MRRRSYKVSTRHITCWHPLLPAFSARLIIALRTLIGIACCATITLSPRTSEYLQGQLLIGIGFIVAMKSTLGATIQNAKRLFLGGAIASAYCLSIVSWVPKSVYSGIGSTAILVLFIVYTDLPVTVRRFTIVPTCIVLLQWITKEHIDQWFVLQTWISLTTGASLAVLVTIIPLPVLPSAYRELTMRMRFVSRQARREMTAIILLISEYHNEHVARRETSPISAHDVEQQMKSKSSIDDDEQTIEMTVSPSTPDGPPPQTLNSNWPSVENLQDDHLLQSDIEDLHSLINEEVKQMQRASQEIGNEPYLIALRALNLTRRLFARLPLLRRCVAPPSTLESRLAIWVSGLVSIQRTITAMLSLDHHHHAFVGQRKLIFAIVRLLESTFNYVDATLPYTTASKNYYSEQFIQLSRQKIEDSLEHFFETYAEVREHPSHRNVSTTDAMKLNTFLLLILRLVHVTMTTAENTETPGTRLPDHEPPAKKKKTSTTSLSCCWSSLFTYLSNYIGLRPSVGKLVRSVKTSLSVCVSAIVVFSLRDRLQAYGWVYWAPMTTALVSDSSEGGTLRLSFQRLMAVLLGSTYAYLVVLVSQHPLAVGSFICLFVGLMGYLKTDPRKEYFASVCAQSASIITFLSHQKGQMTASNKAVLARTSLTFLGIFIHVIISNLLFPITARSLIKRKVGLMMKNIRSALKFSVDDFCSFIHPTNDEGEGEGEGEGEAKKKAPSLDLMKLLSETEKIADSFPALLDEALNEPNFWKRPFVQVKDRYQDVAKALKQISQDIRFIHRCSIILKAESKLHFALEAKWLMRRTSLIRPMEGTNDWRMTELEKEKQLLKDLDIPLKIFLSHSPSGAASPSDEGNRLIYNYSSTSLRLANPRLYRPVVEHIQKLEKQIEDVLLLTEQLIEKEAIIDVGSFHFEQFSNEDLSSPSPSSSDPPTGPERIRTLNRGQSFYAVSQFDEFHLLSNHYRLLSCFRPSHEDIQTFPSLRNSVQLMLAALIQFLSANNRFIRHEFVSNQSIGDVLAFHTLSHAFKDLVQSTTNLAKNARRIKHIDTRTLTPSERQERIPHPSHHHHQPHEEHESPPSL